MAGTREAVGFFCFFPGSNQRTIADARHGLCHQNSPQIEGDFHFSGTGHHRIPARSYPKNPLFFYVFSHKKRMVLNGILYPLGLNTDITLCGGGATVL